MSSGQPRDWTDHRFSNCPIVIPPKLTFIEHLHWIRHIHCSQWMWLIKSPLFMVFEQTTGTIWAIIIAVAVNQRKSEAQEGHQPKCRVCFMSQFLIRAPLLHENQKLGVKGKSLRTTMRIQQKLKVITVPDSIESTVIGSSDKLCGRWEKGETGIVCPQQRNGNSQWYLNMI